MKDPSQHISSLLTNGSVVDQFGQLWQGEEEVEESKVWQSLCCDVDLRETSQMR